MRICFIVVLLSLWTASSFAHDEAYFKVHPKELQQAFNKCHVKPTTSLNCEQLKLIAVRINALAYELRLDPQGYGQKILSLQQQIAAGESSARAHALNADVKMQLDRHKQNLNERLAVVKWLESPVS